jgi:iron complex transport system ATP-binding protein
MQTHGGLSVLLQDVWFQLRGIPILKAIDWEVEAGGRWVLLGPNGSGKTTLLKLITGYAYPSRGRVAVLGRQFGHTDLRELRTRIGWVHYDLRNMIPEFMNALEVVLAGEKGTLSFYEEITPAEKSRAEGNLKALRAEQLSGRRFATLSTGERQRVLIARALMAEPKILLLDEPCMGLDPLSREEFLDSLHTLFVEKPEMTVITVTHHVEEITEGYEGVMILDRGRVLASGERKQTLSAETISRLFGHRCALTFGSGRYSLQFR